MVRNKDGETEILWWLISRCHVDAHWEADLVVALLVISNLSLLLFLGFLGVKQSAFYPY